MNFIVLICILGFVFTCKSSPQLCFTEYSACGHVAVDNGVNQDDVNITTLQPPIETSNMSRTAFINISCPATQLIQINQITMTLYSNSSQCTATTNKSCTLSENQLLNNDPNIINTINEVCQTTIGVNHCETSVDFIFPSETSLLEAECSSLVPYMEDLPVVALEIAYGCHKDCASEQNIDDYYFFWHTFDKSCIAEFKSVDFIKFHLIISSKSIIDLILQYIFAAGAVNNIIAVNVTEVESKLKIHATNEIKEDICEIAIDPNSEVILGNNFERTYATLIRSYPEYFIANDTYCQQRLMVQKVGEMQPLFSICTHNDSSFYWRVLNNGINRVKYWIWYESNDTDVKAFFYLPIEIRSGQATVYCGICNSANLVTESTTITSDVFVNNSGDATTTDTETTTNPPRNYTTIIIIAVSTLSSVTIIILLAALLTILIRYKKSKENLKIVRNKNGSFSIDNADVQSIYEEILENDMTDDKDDKCYDQVVDDMDDKCYHQAVDEDNIQNVYLTSPERLVADKFQKEIEQDHVLDGENTIQNVYLTSPKLSAENFLEKVENTDNSCDQVVVGDNMQDVYLTSPQILSAETYQEKHEENDNKNCDKDVDGVNIHDVYLTSAKISAENYLEKEKENDNKSSDKVVDADNIHDVYLTSPKKVSTENHQENNDNKGCVLDGGNIENVYLTSPTKVSGNNLEKINVDDIDFDPYLKATNVSVLSSNEDIQDDDDNYLTVPKLKICNAIDRTSLPDNIVSAEANTFFEKLDNSGISCNILNTPITSTEGMQHSIVADSSLLVADVDCNYVDQNLLFDEITTESNIGIDSDNANHEQIKFGTNKDSVECDHVATKDNNIDSPGNVLNIENVADMSSGKS